jgi:hypothetical protein
VNSKCAKANSHVIPFDTGLMARLADAITPATGIITILGFA